jgi:hypothetical protein
MAWVVEVSTIRLGGGAPLKALYLSGHNDASEARAAVTRFVNAIEGDNVGTPQIISDQEASALGVPLDGVIELSAAHASITNAKFVINGRLREFRSAAAASGNGRNHLVVQESQTNIKWSLVVQELPRHPISRDFLDANEVESYVGREVCVMAEPISACAESIGNNGGIYCVQEARLLTLCLT